MQNNAVTCKIRDSKGTERLVDFPVQESERYLTSLASSLAQAQEQINQELTKLVDAEKASESLKSIETNENSVLKEEPDAKRLKNSC